MPVLMPAAPQPDPSAARRRALVTGISGQDGSFLAELLLDRGYSVWGMVHGSPAKPLGCAEHLRDRLELVPGDLMNGDSLRAAIEQAAPAELYHLAAPSFVPASWEMPQETLAAITAATAVVLRAARDLGDGVRVYVAGSAMIFGRAHESPQRETTECHPTTPYGVAKLAAHQLVGLMRERYGIHASSGITFNHESERRPERFVSRKITRAAAAASLGMLEELPLGDLQAVRDWSFAGDVVHGAWLMLQQDEPDDYVLASGVARTVADLADAAFAYVGLEAERFIRVDEALVRPPERTPSVGDPTRAHERLGWSEQVSFAQLVERMVQADLRRLQAQL